MNPIELVVWIHVESVRIHPFPDGNEKISHLTISYQLLANGLSAVSIAKEGQLDYLDTLEVYTVEGSLVSLTETAADLIDQQLSLYLGIMEPS